MRRPHINNNNNNATNIPDGDRFVLLTVITVVLRSALIQRPAFTFQKTLAVRPKITLRFQPSGISPINGNYSSPTADIRTSQALSTENSDTVKQKKVSEENIQCFHGRKEITQVEFNDIKCFQD
ncbi:hypothetical protein KIN20_000850 [Parelaphostrongylus tenuis]|uniref:Uncharacterized protein n=1 Tax=Parelaphostrongylus tenuis TaxID=148309 RepID=A0AAD5LSS7_PARTN|nr:hypothetical protein KIN20_000850 [Parelaphostrongylus tenuis]